MKSENELWNVCCRAGSTFGMMQWKEKYWSYGGEMDKRDWCITRSLGQNLMKAGTGTWEFDTRKERPVLNRWPNQAVVDDENVTIPWLRILQVSVSNDNHLRHLSYEVLTLYGIQKKCQIGQNYVDLCFNKKIIRLLSLLETD